MVGWLRGWLLAATGARAGWELCFAWLVVFLSWLCVVAGGGRPFSVPWQGSPALLVGFSQSRLSLARPVLDCDHPGASICYLAFSCRPHRHRPSVFATNRNFLSFLIVVQILRHVVLPFLGPAYWLDLIEQRGLSQ